MKLKDGESSNGRTKSAGGGCGGPGGSWAARASQPRRSQEAHKARSIATIKGVQNLEPTALRRWPDSFGGIWLSQGKLFVAFTDKSRKRLKKLRRPLIRKGRLPKRLAKRRFRAVTVDDSLLSLEQLEGRMIADRDAPPPPSIVPLPKPQYDLNVDVQDNSVVVIVPSATPQLVSYFKQAYGDVSVEQGPIAEPEGCTALTAGRSCARGWPAGPNRERAARSPSTSSTYRG